ncbi:heat shock protein beta-1 isoform X1 [Hyalella azteca]|uniref:Heat shock protein beta-1 isoform X1 n=1 Tax=Hyalella azteca TaxID=294128 RepID=A0A979FIS7_HYAAZ|nr:heat shock protein beta-1 isoform X1 [Hyalella azteca]
MDGFFNIPVRLGDFSVIDDEFNSIRGRFDTEMKKMEEEMSRFRNELMNRESNFFGQSMLTSSSSCVRESRVQRGSGDKEVKRESETFSKSSSSQHDNQLQPQAGGSWLEGMNSPLIQNDGDCKQLKLRFDVSQYKPNEIVVKTVDNKLLVHAKHEEKSDSRSVYREYNREFLLPKGTNPESIKSSLSKDGVLTVEAPLPAITSGETKIPIAMN